MKQSRELTVVWIYWMQINNNNFQIFKEIFIVHSFFRVVRMGPSFLFVKMKFWWEWRILNEGFLRKIVVGMWDFLHNSYTLTQFSKSAKNSKQIESGNDIFYKIMTTQIWWHKQFFLSFKFNFLMQKILMGCFLIVKFFFTLAITRTTSPFSQFFGS